MLRPSLLATCAATSLVGATAQAHIVIAQIQAAAGSTYVAAFRVSHASGDDRRRDQIPASGKAWTSVPRPAPVLNVIAPAPATGTDHAHH
jgi:hypothetical protein